MREIKQIQFVGISPIIAGEARQLLTPSTKGVDKIVIVDGSTVKSLSTIMTLDIFLANGELCSVPISSCVITYKAEQLEKTLSEIMSSLPEPEPKPVPLLTINTPAPVAVKKKP